MDKYIGKTGDIILVLITSFFLLFIVWANLATLEKVIRGEGKVIASAKNQVIQNLEGGIVKDIFVKAGDIVEEGDSLLEFDDTFLRSELDASIIELKNLKIEVSFLKRSRELIFEELDILEPLVEQGAESRMELIRVLQRKANAESDISRKQADIESLEERIPALKDRTEDIPLLIENKIYKKNYILVYVDAKKKDINKKLKKRKNYDQKIIKKLRKLQLPLEIKKKKSDYLIKNDFKRLNLKKSVKILKNKILYNNARNRP